MATASADSDDYSAASTVVIFDRPLPLLRQPLPAGSSDDSSSGPFVLGFRDVQSWKSAHKSCESKLTEQCEAAARIGCAISASSKCKPPWWRSLIGASETDFTQREKCEEREMAVCVETSKENCFKFARDKCLPAFMDARIGIKERRVDWREASKLIIWASSPASASEMNLGLGLIGVRKVGDWKQFKDRVLITNCRGSDLLG